MQNSGLSGSIRIAAPALGEVSRLVLAAPDMGDTPRLEHGVSLLAQPVEIGLCTVEPLLDDVRIHIRREVLAAPPLRQQRTNGRARDRDRLGRQGDDARVIRPAQVGAEALDLRMLIARAGERDERHLSEQIPKIVPLLKRREHIRADDEIQGGQCNIVILGSCMSVCCILTLIPTIFIDVLKNNESKSIKYVVIALAVLICSILNTTLSYTAMIVWIFPMLVASLYYNKTMVLYTALLSTVGVFAADIVNYRLCDLVIPPAHDDFADNMILVIAPCVIAIFIMSFVSYFIVSRNSTMLNNVIDHAEEVKTNQKELIYAFAELSESKSKSTGEHIKRVAKYMEVLGKASGFDDDYVDMLSTAAMMHDIGKLMISEEILNKPSRLTDEDFAIMKSHVLYGDALLSKCPGQILQIARTIAKEHHEKWDGSGYLHMKGEEIAYISRLMAVCDVFDALTSARYYKKGWSMEEAYTEIVSQSGKQFDPKVVLLFQAHFKEFKQIAEQNADKHIY